MKTAEFNLQDSSRSQWQPDAAGYCGHGPSSLRLQRSSLALLCGLAMSLAACDKSTSKRNISEPPLRAGAPLTKIAARYIDHKPTLSADGTRVVFLSGRESQDDRAVFRLYKAEWPAGQAPAAPQRLTSSDEAGSERDGVISPDGQFVLLSAAKGETSDLWLVNFATGVVKAITQDAAVEASYSFSPDSKAIAWVARDLNAGTGTAQVATLDAAGNLGAAVQASSLGSYAASLVWAPADGGYRLVLGLGQNQGSGRVSFELVEFASLAELGQAKRTSIAGVQNIVTEPKVSAYADRSRLLVARQIVPVGAKTAAQSGDYPYEKPVYQSVRNEALLLDLAAGNLLAEGGGQTGHELLGLAATADAAQVVSLNRAVYQCAGDKNPRVAAAIHIASEGLSNTVRWLPRANPAGGFGLVADYCERLAADGTMALLDERVEAIALASNATSSKKRLAYTTRYTADRDADCRLLSGDPEIHVIDEDAGNKTVYPLSANPAPSADTRPQGVDCPY